jgi:hypothetical protein
MRKISSAVLALGCWLAGAQGQELQPGQEPEPGPELDFLEYLGAWAEDDDEWLAIEEWEKDNNADAEAEAEAEEEAEESESESDDDDESE